MPTQPGLSRISDGEMRRLMLEASEKLTNMLRLKQEYPAKYEICIGTIKENICFKWNRD
jgi:hypothetical protein